MRRCKGVAVAAVLGAVLIGATALAQRIWVGGGRFWRTAPKWAAKANFDGSFNYCRGFYTSNRREAGGSGWDTDYPGSDNNFSVRLAQMTLIHVKVDPAGPADYVGRPLNDSLLF